VATSAMTLFPFERSEARKELTGCPTRPAPLGFFFGWAPPRAFGPGCGFCGCLCGCGAGGGVEDAAAAATGRCKPGAKGPRVAVATEAVEPSLSESTEEPPSVVSSSWPWAWLRIVAACALFERRVCCLGCRASKTVGSSKARTALANTAAMATGF